MFRKRLKKQEFVRDKAIPSESPPKQYFNFHINFKPRFARKLEVHSVSRHFAEKHGTAYRAYRKEPCIITAFDSIVGKRENQQDSFYVTPSGRVSPFKMTRTFAVVCDGMGGLEAGDRASLTAVAMMKIAVNKLPLKRIDIPHFFSEMVDYIDCEINEWKDLATERGSGTTIVAALVENRRLYWVSVGDSSIFMFQDNTLKKITSEHNYKMYLDRLVSCGKMTREQAEKDPQQNSLLSYLGMGGVAYRDINSKPYVMKNGDWLLLCTDGVTDTLTQDELADIVRKNIDDAAVCCKEITAAVTEKNLLLQDNATVVILQYVE